jgi:hypothetical protein
VNVVEAAFAGMICPVSASATAARTAPPRTIIEGFFIIYILLSFRGFQNRLFEVAGSSFGIGDDVRAAHLIL